MLMGEEDAVYSREINRRQKENSGDDCIPETKGGTRLTPSKMKNELFIVLPLWTRPPPGPPKPNASP